MPETDFIDHAERSPMTRRTFVRGAFVGAVLAIGSKFLPPIPGLKMVGPLTAEAGHCAGCGGVCAYGTFAGCWWRSACAGSCGGQNTNAALVHIQEYLVWGPDQYQQCTCALLCGDWYEYWCGALGCCQ